MIGLALILILAGIVLFFLFPYGGVVVGVVGIVLLIAFALGFGRRAQAPGP